MSKRVITGKPELMKRINKNIVIKMIMRNDILSRSGIAEQTKLALPTVMRIVDELIEEGLVTEIGKGNSTGGRKPSMISLKKEAMYFIGVEIAAKVTVVISNLGGEILSTWREKASTFKEPQLMLEAILESVELLIQQSGISRKLIAGIGVGTPGTNFKHSDEIGFSIFKGWEKFNVQNWFQERTEFPVVVENVAKTQTLGELWFGIGKHYKDFIYIFVDQGVGCGIVNNGDIYYGNMHVAGEFGHMIIERKGKLCYCGNRGCLEMYTSTSAIVSTILEKLDTYENNLDFSKVLERLDNGDDIVKEIITNIGETMGIGLGNLINFYNPQAIILGGEVSRECPLFFESARSAAYQRIFSNAADSTAIHLSGIESNKTCIGSVALIVNEIFKAVQL